jgi:hypothetical protein
MLKSDGSRYCQVRRDLLSEMGDARFSVFRIVIM